LDAQAHYFENRAFHSDKHESLYKQVDEPEETKEPEEPEETKEPEPISVEKRSEPKKHDFIDQASNDVIEDEK
jgi:hypothetical protein